MNIEKQGTEFYSGDLCRAIETVDGYNAAETDAVLDAIARLLPKILYQHGRIEIQGIGVFTLVDREAKMLPDPTGGPSYLGDPYKKVKFRAAAGLCRELEDITGINVV